jgi:hypothetical protein
VKVKLSSKSTHGTLLNGQLVRCREKWKFLQFEATRVRVVPDRFAFIGGRRAARPAATHVVAGHAMSCQYVISDSLPGAPPLEDSPAL